MTAAARDRDLTAERLQAEERIRLDHPVCRIGRRICAAGLQGHRGSHVPRQHERIAQ